MHSPVIEDQSSLKRETLCKIVLKSEFRGKEGLKSVIKANILIGTIVGKKYQTRKIKIKL